MPRLHPLFALAVCTLAALPSFAAASAASLIAQAGNASDEGERLIRLRTLAGQDEAVLDRTTRAELAALLPIVADWAEGRQKAEREIADGLGETHRYLHRFFENATDAYTPSFPTPPRAESPLYPLWAFYRARFLTWFMIEDSGVLNVPARKKAFLGEAERCFEVARKAFPENAVLQIYGGKNLPVPELSPWDDRAPAWANHQRRALEQLHKIIHWWIAERQLSNGEFGGKWGDDVEMWRWWAPVLIGFDDPAVTAAQERLARGNLSRPGMAAGYTNQLTDVEHTAEETADTLTPMLHARSDDPSWTSRARRLLDLADATWWGRNERGQLQFKHIDFNHERLGSNVGRAYDTAYHVRVMQPVLLLWQRTNDPALRDRLTPWLRTWAAAARSTENGKPAGIVPAALQWPSGRIGSAERGWIGPNLAGDPMIDLYSWPAHPVAAMMCALLQAHIQTGEPEFFEPLPRTAELRRAHLAAGNQDGPPGSLDWAAHRLPLVMNDALAKWRQLTGNSRFDDLLRSDASSYVRYMLARDEGSLTDALRATAETLGVNWPMFTSEVRYTDRVLSFPHAWPRTVATGLRRIDANLIYSSVTGDPGSPAYFPLNGTRWHTRPRDIAALLVENRRDRCSAELFHFASGERHLAVSLLLLEPGIYSWQLTTQDGRTLTRGEQAITTANRRLEFTLPSRTTCRLTVTRVP